MKQAILLLFLSFALLNTDHASAQNSKVLNIDQYNIFLENLTVLDSSAGGRLVHTAVMDIAMRDNESGSVIKTLYAGVTEKRQLNLSIKTIDLSGKVVEDRNYSGAIVQEMILPVMDGADKGVVRVQVKIVSSSLSIKYDGVSGGTKLGTRSSAALSANFRFTLGGLPSSRIAKISAVRIASNQLPLLVVDVSDADARAWQNWLLSSASKREQGVIEWLSANMKDVIFRIELRDIEIVSASSNFTGESRTISRTSFGLRGRVVIPADGK